MDAYSLTLALALLAGGVGLLAMFSGRAHHPAERAHRLGRVSGSVGLALAIAAFTIHIVSGHRPGSVNALGPIRFAGEHPALVAAGILAMATLWGARTK